MPRISADDAGINDVNLTEQSANPTTPASGTQIVFAKSTGVFVKDSAGTVTGPLGEGGGPGTDTSAVHVNASGEINGVTAKTTPADNDVALIEDSAASFAKKKLSWSNLKATLKTYFDTLYATLTHTTPTFVASGGSHAAGHVPDPGAGAGSTKFLREDATWAVPSGSGDVSGPGSATGGDIATFNGGTGKVIQDSGVAISTDGTFATNSNAKVPTEQASKTYTDTSIANITPTGTIVQGTFIVSGCQVTYSGTNLDYIVAAGQYYIQGTLYTIAQATVTLAAANTQDRIDVIYANTSQAVGSITGTAGTNPSEPSYDPTTQIPLRFVIVYANSSTPSGVTTETIYQDNAGAPAEWAWTTSGSGFNVNSTNNPYTGTKDIEGTTVANAAYAKGIKGSSGTIDLANYQQLVFYIRFKAAFANGRVLQCQWFASGVAKGNPLVITQGQFGLNGSNTTTYQAVIIPALQFAVPAGTLITELRFTDSGGSIGFYLDAITLISESGSTGGSGGITQQQADARYAQLAVSFPSTSTDKAIARFSGTTGKIVQNSVATVSDTGTVNIPTGQTYNINSSPHTHALTGNTPTASAVGDTGAVGTGTAAAKDDHKHGREAFGSVAAQTSYGSSSADGSATTVAHSDHTHGTPSLSTNSPAAVAGTAAAGSGSAPSKDDHAHVGVHSVAKNGSTGLVGDITLTGGSNVTLTQSGNDISIAAAGASGVTRSGATTDGHLAIWNGSSADSIKDGGAIPSSGVVYGQTNSYPTTFTGDTINGSSTTPFVDVAAFDVKEVLNSRVLHLKTLGASKDQKVRVTLGTTQAGAFDVTVCCAFGGLFWSDGLDAYLSVRLSTSADAQIAQAKIGTSLINATAGAKMRSSSVEFGGSGAPTKDANSEFNAPMGSAYTLRFVRDGSNVISYWVGVGTAPLALVPVTVVADNTLYTNTVSGTLERIEFLIHTPGGPGASARFDAYVDYIASV